MIRKLSYVMILISFVGYILLAYQENIKQLPEKDVANAAELSQDSAFSQVIKPIYSDPVKLYTQNLKAKIQLNLIDVGVAQDGSLETPKQWNMGGWFANSARPGEEGNMVINGHFDDNYGRPAAFWQLKNIKVGDIVFVQDLLNKVYPYKVTKSFYLSISDPERLKVLGKQEGKSHLTMITCGGIWIPEKHTYSDRLVVIAELADSFEVL